MLPLAWILLLFSSLSGAASVICKGAGDEVVISSGSDHGRITAITWKHNEDIAVEWYGGEPSVYRHFNGCTTLDIFTGVLTISGLTRDHSGFYTAEINNRVFDTTEVRIISPVPKPTVSKWCDAKRTYCTLTCEGDTTDAEPVTYSWEIFDVLNYYKGQQINLTKEDHDPWYRCKMKNPISSETSEEFPNPFSSGNQMFIIILVLLFLVLLLIGLIVGIVIHRKRKGSFSLVKFLRSKIPKSNDQTENTRLLEVSCNGGVVPAVSIEETSVQILQKSSVVPDTNTQTAALNINETSNPDKTSKKPDDEPENSPKKEEETQVQIHSPETPESNHQTGSFSLLKFLRSKTPESNHQTATTSSKDQEVLMSVEETSNESEISPDQVQTSEEIPESSAQTENSPKKEEEIEVQVHISETPESNNQTENSPKEEEVEVQIHKSETPESNNQTATTTSEGQEVLMSVAETSNESATDSQDQNTSSNDLKTAASTETENSPKKEEETQVQIHSQETPESNHQTGSFSLMKFLRSKTPESNHQTATTSSKDQEVLMSVEETSNESEISPDQVQTNEQIPESSAQTENSPKKEEEIEVHVHRLETPENNNQTENSPKKEETEVQDHKSETENNNQTATTTSEGQGASMSVAETSHESVTDSQDQNTSSNDLQTAASKETDESAEESNGEETTIPLLEERDYSISVSA